MYKQYIYIRLYSLNNIYFTFLWTKYNIYIRTFFVMYSNNKIYMYKYLYYKKNQIKNNNNNKKTT